MCTSLAANRDQLLYGNTPTHLQLLVHSIRQLLSVGLEQLNGVLERLKHVVSNGLPVLHLHEVAHHPHQPIVVALLHHHVKTSTGQLDELLQAIQAVQGCGCEGRGGRKIRLKMGVSEWV